MYASIACFAALVAGRDSSRFANRSRFIQMAQNTKGFPLSVFAAFGSVTIHGFGAWASVGCRCLGFLFPLLVVLALILVSPYLRSLRYHWPEVALNSVVCLSVLSFAARVGGRSRFAQVGDRCLLLSPSARAVGAISFVCSRVGSLQWRARCLTEALNGDLVCTQLL